MSIRNLLLQPYDIRMLIVDGSVGVDDDSTVQAIEKTLKRKLTSHEIEKLSAGAGEQAITFTFRDCVGVRFFSPDFADRTLHAVHEAFHVVCSVMRFVGVRLTGASEEAFAYLLAHVHSKLLEGEDAQ